MLVWGYLCKVSMDQSPATTQAQQCPWCWQQYSSGRALCLIELSNDGQARRYLQSSSFFKSTHSVMNNNIQVTCAILPSSCWNHFNSAAGEGCSISCIINAYWCKNWRTLDSLHSWLIENFIKSQISVLITGSQARKWRDKTVWLMDIKILCGV